MNLLGSSFVREPRDETDPLLLIMSLLKEEAETEDSDTDEALILSIPSSSRFGNLWFISCLPVSEKQLLPSEIFRL